MKLSEILEQVDVMVPNSLSPNIKIAWINQVQNHLYRDYPLSEAVAKFTVFTGESIYSLPDDCPEDRLDEVVIDDVHYPFLPSNGEPEGKFCTIVAGSLMIYPAPLHAGIGFIFYKQRPTQFSVNDLTAESNFPMDFQELLVIGCASRVAKSNPETVNLAGVFDQDYRVLADKADIVLRRKRPNQVTIARYWR